MNYKEAVEIAESRRQALHLALSMAGILGHRADDLVRAVDQLVDAKLDEHYVAHRSKDD